MAGRLLFMEDLSTGVDGETLGDSGRTNPTYHYLGVPYNFTSGSVDPYLGCGYATSYGVGALEDPSGVGRFATVTHDGTSYKYLKAHNEGGAYATYSSFQWRVPYQPRSGYGLSFWYHVVKGNTTWSAGDTVIYVRLRPREDSTSTFSDAIINEGMSQASQYYIQNYVGGTRVGIINGPTNQYPTGTGVHTANIIMEPNRLARSYSQRVSSSEQHQDAVLGNDMSSLWANPELEMQIILSIQGTNPTQGIHKMALWEVPTEI